MFLEGVFQKMKKEEGMRMEELKNKEQMNGMEEKGKEEQVAMSGQDEMNEIYRTLNVKLSSIAMARDLTGKEVIGSEDGTMLIRLSTHYDLILPEYVELNSDGAVVNPLKYYNKISTSVLDETNLHFHGVHGMYWCKVERVTQLQKERVILCDPRSATHLFIACKEVKIIPLNVDDICEMPGSFVIDDIKGATGMNSVEDSDGTNTSTTLHCFTMPIGYMRLFWCTGDRHYRNIRGDEVSCEGESERLKPFFEDRRKKWCEEAQKCLDNKRRIAYAQIAKRREVQEKNDQCEKRLSELQRKCVELERSAKMQAGEDSEAIDTLFAGLKDEDGKFVSFWPEAGSFYVFGRAYDYSWQEVERVMSTVKPENCITQRFEEWRKETEWRRKVEELIAALIPYRVKIVVDGRRIDRYEYARNVSVTIHEKQLKVTLKGGPYDKIHVYGEDFEVCKVVEVVSDICESKTERKARSVWGWVGNRLKRG